MEVVDMDHVAGHVDPMLVGGSVRHPPLHATAGEPRGKHPVVMLAAGGSGCGIERGAAKLRGPDDERVVEHPPALEILEKPCDRLIDVLRQGEMRHHVAMGIPVGR